MDRPDRPCETAALEKAVAAAAVTRIRVPPALLDALPLPSPPPAVVQEGVTLPVEPTVVVVALLCALLLLASAGYGGLARPFIHPTTFSKSRLNSSTVLFQAASHHQ